MPLSHQRLRIGDKGSAVQQLHTALQQLGVGNEIPVEEINGSFYGKGTAQVVAAFQQKNGLMATGEVDAATAKAINAAIEPPQSKPISTSFIVRGQIRTPDAAPLPDLTVRAFNQLTQTALGKDASTNKEGHYEIQYTSKDFEGDGKDGRNPNILIRVFKGETLLAESPITQNAQANERIDLIVTLQEAKRKKDSDKTKEEGSKTKEQLKVSGTVFNQQQEPLAEKQVVVVDVDLRGAAIATTAQTIQQLQESNGFEILDTAHTDLKGHYEVSFTPESFQRSELRRADVIAYAIENEIIAGRSRLIVWKDNQQPEINDLDITLTESKQRGASEYERLSAVLQPLLVSSKLQLHELNQAQSDFLAQETDREAEYIALLVQADKLRLDIANQSFKTELFYGIGRQEIPLTWAAIGAKSDDHLRRALKLSIEQNVIAAQSSDVIESFIHAIRQHSISTLLKDSSIPEAKALAETLKTALPDNDAQAKFLEAATNFHHTDPQKFWQEHLPAAGFKNTNRGLATHQPALSCLRRSPAVAGPIKGKECN